MSCLVHAAQYQWAPRFAKRWWFVTEIAETMRYFCRYPVWKRRWRNPKLIVPPGAHRWFTRLSGTLQWLCGYGCVVLNTTILLVSLNQRFSACLEISCYHVTCVKIEIRVNPYIESTTVLSDTWVIYPTLTIILVYHGECSKSNCFYIVYLYHVFFHWFHNALSFWEQFFYRVKIWGIRR